MNKLHYFIKVNNKGEVSEGIQRIFKENLREILANTEN